jgi:integrase
MRTISRLKNRQVATAKPPNGRRSAFIADGGNLYLQVSLGTKDNVRRSWIFLFERNGRRHAVGLGPIHTTSLKRARRRARELREQLLDSIDPLAEKRKAKQALLAELARAVTFEKVTDMYLDAHSGEWRSEDHHRQWVSSMNRYVLPRFGKMSVADIDTAAVVKVLEPIWKDRRETASRVRGRIEAVLDFATVREFRRGDNPARWKNHLSELFAAKTAPIEHLPAIPYDELPAFMIELRKHDILVAKALEFLTLAVARTGRVVEAVWDEIKWDEKAWVIEAAKMKRQREHVTPLCARAMEILASLRPADALPGDKIFPIGDDSMRRLLVELRPGFTPHGLRSSFYDWASDRTATAENVIKLAMSHAVGDKTERAYRRGQMFEKRRRLAQQWQDFLDRPTASKGAVPIRKGEAHA